MKSRIGFIDGGSSVVENRNEIEKKVIEVLAKMLHKDEGDIRLESTLVDELEMDSFTAVELLFELEDQYGLEIPDEEVENFKTVEDIIDYIVARLEE
jgi:acyl carrier protein